MSGGEFTEPCVTDFRLWLWRLGSGCKLAQHFAIEALITFEVVEGTELTPEWIASIDAALDQAAAERHVGVVLFPAIHTAEEVAGVIEALSAESAARWSVTRVPSEPEASRNNGLVRVHWRTSAGPETSVMGMAPLRCMPITRRAPYMALMMWPTTRGNDYAPPSRSPTIGIIEAAHTLDPTEHKKRWDRTVAEVGERFAHDRDGLGPLRDVAFRLPLGIVDRVLK